MNASFAPFCAVVTAAVAALSLVAPVAAAGPVVRSEDTVSASAASLRTGRTAIPAAPALIRAGDSGGASDRGGQTGYLGIALHQAASAGPVVVSHVDPRSPASAAGLRADEVLLRINDARVTSAADARETLLTFSPGETVRLTVRTVAADAKKGGAEATRAVVLGAQSLPRRLSGKRALLGATVRESPGGDGVVLGQVQRGQPAASAGLRAGDVLVRIGDENVLPTATATDLFAAYAPGDTVTVAYLRAGRPMEARVTLGGDPTPGTDIASYRRAGVFRKGVYRLAVIGLSFPDTPRDAAISDQAWADSLFSTGTYTTRSATGQTVHGSLNDYFREVSAGKLKVEGRVFPWVTAEKKRADYAVGTGDRTLLAKTLEQLAAREGENALDGFDGVMFLYAGGRGAARRGNLFWPHRSSVSFRGKRLSYFILPELAQAGRMTDISVACHEFGHMLGLPDLYPAPGVEGSEGLGQWCLMASQLGQGQPQHPSAWCKEQMGWLKPTVLDPRVPQHLVLSPVEGSDAECFKVPIRPDGSEYFLLEVRRKTGFDAKLPGEGLLVWRVVRGRPFLEESTGVEGPLGPRSFASSVPYPSASNRAFTPLTTPSSKALLGGGLPLYLSEIERLPDGRVTFRIGYPVQ